MTRETDDTIGALVRELGELYDSQPLETDKRIATEASRLGLNRALLRERVISWARKLAREHAAPDVTIIANAGPVDGHELLLSTLHSVRQFLVMSDSASLAAVLWSLHTHCAEVSYIAPMLAIESPLPSCGKSTLMTWLQHVVARPFYVSSITPASIFRLLDAEHCTLLIDECDKNGVDRNDELLNMLNCGHSRSTAQVARVEGDAADRRVERYDCFGPKCLAGIGSRADTVRSRAVVIPLSRAADGETVQELEIADADTRAALYAIRDRMTAWAAQSLPMLHTAKPDMSGMGGRMRDNWRPLLAIADLCGYGAEARAAAIELAKAAAEIATDDGERSLSVQLLRCIRDVFESGKYAGHEHITTVELLHELCGDDEQPWCTWRRGEPMGPRALVKLLRPFAIQPVQIGAQRARSRGYRRAQFVSAWRRYT